MRYASFWGGVNLSLPFFADRASGKHQVGFFPSLATQLGAGSFEAGGTKYATYLARGTRLAQEVRTAWAALQQEASVGATFALWDICSRRLWCCLTGQR